MQGFLRQRPAQRASGDADEFRGNLPVEIADCQLQRTLECERTVGGRFRAANRSGSADLWLN